MNGSVSIQEAKNRLLGAGGYLPVLLERFGHMVGELENPSPQTDRFLIAKTLYVAEMFDNEIDAYTMRWLVKSHIEGMAEWRQTEEFKQAWRGLKSQRDQIYGRLITALKKIPLLEIEKWVKWYGDDLMRYLRPAPPVPQPPSAGL